MQITYLSLTIFSCLHPLAGGQAGPFLLISVTRRASSRYKQQSLQLSHNPLRRLAIPFRWNRPFLPLPGHQSCKRWRQLARISPDQFVGADGDGFWALGVVTEGRVGLQQYLESIELACGLIECDGRVTAARLIG